MCSFSDADTKQMICDSRYLNVVGLCVSLIGFSILIGVDLRIRVAEDQQSFQYIGVM